MNDNQWIWAPDSVSPEDDKVEVVPISRVEDDSSGWRRVAPHAAIEEDDRLVGGEEAAGRGDDATHGPVLVLATRSRDRLHGEVGRRVDSEGLEAAARLQTRRCNRFADVTSVPDAFWCLVFAHYSWEYG